MRITHRQLRQIIREELTRGLREQDETAQGAVAMPSAKKRGIFGPRETPEDEATWNAGWRGLSKGEREIYIAGVLKGSPEALAELAGRVVRNGDYDETRFMDFLKTPYPKGGSSVFEEVVGGARPGGLSVAQSATGFSKNFSGNDRRIGVFRNLAMPRVIAPSDRVKMMERMVAANAELVAGLERVFFEGFFQDTMTGGLLMPDPERSRNLYTFVKSALGT